MLTKLERFRRANNIRPSDLAKASGMSPKMLELIRKGHNTTIQSAKDIAAGVSRLVGRDVQLDDLFDLSVPAAKKGKRVA